MREHSHMVAVQGNRVPHEVDRVRKRIEEGAKLISELVSNVKILEGIKVKVRG